MAASLKTVVILVVVLAAGFLLGGSLRPEPDSQQKETAYQRVMRTRTIRCAYAAWPPHLKIDPRTHALSGIDYDVMQAIGRATGLEIVWEDEIGGALISEQLKSGKQDVFCTAIWENGRRAQQVEMTRPFDYMPLFAFVRDGDTRFNEQIEKLNDDAFTIAVLDGSAQEALAKGSFPKAKTYSLPQNADAVDSLLAVTAKKADVVFADAAVIEDYNSHNPDKKLTRVLGTRPLRVYGDIFAVAKGEIALRDLLSAALTELLNDGTVDRILTRHETAAGSFLRVSPPYEADSLSSH